MTIYHQIRECPQCAFRFPMLEKRDANCPFCKIATEMVAGPYPEIAAQPSPRTPGHKLEILLDNLRSLHNVGSIFRSSDGAGISHIHLCGMTPTPAHPKLAKTALGAQEEIPWSQHRNGLIRAKELIGQGKQLWALEGGGEPLYETELTSDNIVLELGNEISGIDPAIHELCQKTISIPMQGNKSSLNVAVAFGIAVYNLRFGQCS